MLKHNHKQFVFIIIIKIIYLCTIGNSLITKQRPTSDCGFKCMYSNECIAEDQECDGTKDCEDGTDETSTCQRLKCPIYAFKCSYGACISRALVCDGKEDCADGSDESNCGLNKNCRFNDFQCNSGECINSLLVCDGVTDCNDHSDETYATCSHRACRNNANFRCNYGACIDAKLQCDGVNNCRDGSDEDPKICSTFTPTTIRPLVLQQNVGYSCGLPSHPDNGKWMVFGSSGSLQPNDAVDNGTSLYVSCNENYKLQGAAFVTCFEGVWSAPLGYCEVMCPPLNYNATVSVNCSLDNQMVSCSQPVNQTIAVIVCNTKNQTKESDGLRVCRNGAWEPPLPSCGQFSVNFLINVNIYARNKND